MCPAPRPHGEPMTWPQRQPLLIQEAKVLKAAVGKAKDQCVSGCAPAMLCPSSIHTTSSRDPSVISSRVPGPVLLFLNSPALISSHRSARIFPPHTLFCSVLETNCRVLCMLGKCSAIEPHTKPHPLLFSL